MYKRGLTILAALNIALFGAIMVTPASAEEGWPTCCNSDVHGNGFCASCWWTHDCHATIDCQKKVDG